jgi:hypothetical protein
MRARYPMVLAGGLLLLPLLSFQTLVAQMKSPGRHEVAGIVVDEGKAPVPSAELVLKRQGEQSRTARSDNDGRFSFADVQPGPAALTVRRLGYTAKTVNIDVTPSGVAAPVEVELEEIASDIAAVVVEGSKGHLQEFYDHMANSNFAKFFERKDIEKRNPLYLSELLRSVAGASVYAKGAGNRIMLRDCKPMVWVDGMRAPGAELDDVARPMDVAGIEVYPSYAGLPAQYQDRNNRMCGAILVWTRNQ